MFSIIIAMLVFGFLILTHELGHFLFAKKCGIGVIEFSLGMGPRILSKQIGETRYSLKCIPFGGSCAMVGEDEEADEENAFGNKPVWARILVVAGGPALNLISAFILSLIITACVGINPPMIYQVGSGYSAEEAGLKEGDVVRAINGHKIGMGRDIDLLLLNHPLDGSDVTVTVENEQGVHDVVYDPHYETYRMGISYYADGTRAALGAMTETSPAYEAGLREGDIITAIDGTSIDTGEELNEYFAAHKPDGSPISLRYERDGKEAETQVTPVFYETNSLGFEASYYREKVGPLGVIKGGLQEVSYWVRYTLMSLRMLISGQVGVQDMSGPVGIVSAIGDTVETSRSDGMFYVIMNLLNMAVLLSANLGILNLMPIPALDGGRLVFLIIEALRGKPLSQDKEGMVHAIGFALLMALMVFVLFNDIVKLFF